MGYGGVATVAGRHAGRADRPARAAGRARPPGERPAHPPHGQAVVPPGRHRSLVPAGAERDALPAGLRDPDRGGSARGRVAVPARGLGRDRRDRAAGGRGTPPGHRGAEPRLPRQPDRPGRVRGPVRRPGGRRTRPRRRAGRVREPSRSRPRGQRRAGDRRPRGRGAGGLCFTAAGPYSPQARAIVAQVRDVPPPPGARAYVGGENAALVDELVQPRPGPAVDGAGGRAGHVRAAVPGVRVGGAAGSRPS